MAWELNTGSAVGSLKMSLWSMTRMPAAPVSSQSGVWPSVTRYTVRTNGAYICSERREYFSSSWLV